MQTTPGAVALSLKDLRAVTAYAAACAEPTLGVFDRSEPEDRRPRAAVAAAHVFAEGAPRTRLQRTAAADARRAAGAAATEPARYAALAAADAAASAYLQPRATTTQLRHILGAAVHSARAAELSRGDDAVVAAYVLDSAARRVDPLVRDVLDRYPRAAAGRSRLAVLLRRLDELIRDPPPSRRVVDDPGPFFHGTKVDRRPGETLSPGRPTNYGSGKLSRHVYVTALVGGAAMAASLAAGDGEPRVYRVEPLGLLHDDPNVTDMRFPGNPTRSYRTTADLRIVEEIRGFERLPEERIAAIRASTAELAALGVEAMD